MNYPQIAVIAMLAS